MGKRAERLGGQILKEVSRLLQREIRDPRVGFATVSRVELDNELAVAKIYVSIMGGEKERVSTMIALKNSTSFVRKSLALTLRVRHVPEVRFIHDINLDHAASIEALLGSLNDPDIDDIKPSGEDT